MTDHSQNGEASIILDYFAGRKGNLIDIGAYDGVSLSNTYDLILQGWTGVFLEPDKSSFSLLKDLYRYTPGTRIHNFGIALQSGTQEFHLNGMLSTLHSKRDSVDYIASKAYFKSWKDFYRNEKYNFVSIDAEGADFEILKQIDLQEIGAECLCIEHNGNEEILSQIIDYCNMKEIHRNAENIILVK